MTLSPSDHAALERIAKSDESRAAVRARAILAMANGVSVSAAARETGATRVSVRRWMERVRIEGVAAIAGPEAMFDTAFAALPPSEPPATLLREEAGRTGRLPRARLRLECWVRNTVSLGLLPVGSPLPGRLWFERRFRVGAAAADSALRRLAEEGFIRTADGLRPVIAPPSFTGRFLLVLIGARLPDGSLDGFCRRLADAAKSVSRSRGVRFDIIWENTATPDDPELAAAVRDVARQRYEGVFLRMAWAAAPKLGGPGIFSSLPAVPMLALHIHSKTVVSPLVREVCPPPTFVSRPDALCAEAERRGWRHVLAVDALQEDREKRLAAKRALLEASAAHGLRIPDYGLCVVDPHMPDLAIDDLCRLFALLAARGASAIVVLCDNAVPLVVEALRRVFGAARAARFPILAWSEGVAKVPRGMRIVWRSFDLARALSDFVEWCGAIHAGRTDAPVPHLSLR